MANINPQVVIYQVIYQVEVSDETSSTTAAVAETSLTFSFCCDLATLSFLCSLFNLSSSSSCCRAAIAASSLATSSCCALHCCSYTHAHANARQRVGGEKNKTKLLAITSCAKRIARCETTSWAPPLWRCPRCEGGLSNVSHCQTHPNLRNLKGNLTYMTYHHTHSPKI